MNPIHSTFPFGLPRQAAYACFACALAFLTVGCTKNAKQETKIKQLTKDLQRQQSDNENIRSHIQRLEQENSNLRSKANQAEQLANTAKSQATAAQRELEILRTAKAAEAARTRTEASPEKVAAAQISGFTKQLAAIVTIDGNLSKGRGIVVKADGKTWIYSAAQSFSGNSQLSVKDASGNAMTKFGEFQIAADSLIARLEVLQEMPTAFELAPDAPVTVAANFMTAAPSPDTGVIQAIECHSTADVVGNEFALDAYGTEQAIGSPVVASDSGKLVAILALPPPITSLWPDAQNGSSEVLLPKAQRINRNIDWKKSSLASFIAERKKIDEINGITRLLYAVSAIRFANNQLQIDGTIGEANVSSTEVLKQHASQPLVVDLLAFQKDLAAMKVRASERDLARRVVKDFQEAEGIARRQVQDLKIASFSSYHKPMIEAAMKWRTAAEQVIATAIAGLPK